MLQPDTWKPKQNDVKPENLNMWTRKPSFFFLRYLDILTLTWVNPLTIIWRGAGVWLCVIRALDRSGITSNTRVSSTAHRIACNNEQVPGAGKQTCTHVPNVAAGIVWYRPWRPVRSCSDTHTNNSVKQQASRTKGLIIILIITGGGHLPKILVHRFEEEFVAINRPIVEDIFKIR